MRKLKLTNGRRALLYIFTPIFCVFLCLGAVFSISLNNNKVTASADTVAVKQSAAYLDLDGSGKILNAFEGEQKENVYFGSNSGSAMKWRVLAKNDSKYVSGNNNLLLWSEKVLSKENYNLYTTNPNYAYWGTSYIRARLNGGEYLEGIKNSTNAPSLITEATTAPYINSLFNEIERNGVKSSTCITDEFAFTTTKTSAYSIYLKNGITENSHDNDTPYYYFTDELQRESAKYVTTATTASNVQETTSDKLFLLDYYDINNANYGFYDLVEGEKQSYATKINQAWPNLDFFPGFYDNNNRGTINASYLSCADSVSSYYWLRHAGRTSVYDSIALVAGSTGNVWTDGVGSGTYGIRPAFVLDTTKIAYATTVNQTGTWSDLSQLSAKPEYKLYLKDGSYVSNAKAVIGAKNNTLNIRYNNPTGKSGGKLLVLLSDKSKGDGSIAWQIALDMESTSASNYVFKTVSLPSGVSLDTHNVTLLYTSDNKDYATESIYCSYETGGITAPTDIVDSSIVYDGNSKWIDNLGDNTPEWVDKNIYCNEAFMTVSAITYKSTAEGATAVPLAAPENGKLTDRIVDAGEYEVTMTIADGLKWTGNSETGGDKTFKIKIEKKPSSVTPKFASMSNNYVPDSLPAISLDSGSTDGIIAWNDGETPKVGTHKYKWSFIPEDKNNYTEIKDVEKEFTFTAREIDTVTITAFNPVNENDEAVTVFTNATKTTLMSYLTVEVKYKSFTETKTLDAGTYELYINDDDLLVAGDNNLKVKYSGKWSSEFEIHNVVELTYVSIEMLVLKTGVKFTYPVEESDIIAAISEVSAKRNDGEGYDLTEAEIASLMQIEGDLTAGTKQLTFKIKDTEAQLKRNITIAKGTYDVSGVGLTGNKNPVYGQAYELTTSGTVPDGVTAHITYKKEGEATASDTAPTDAGTYTVTLTFTPDDSDNYEAISETVTETLTIQQAVYPDSGNISFVGGTVTHDGSSHKLEVTGVPTGVTVTYKYGSTEQSAPFEFKDVNESGYTVTAIFSHSNQNYKKIADIQATLIITNKHTYNVSNLAFTVSGASGSNGSYTATYSPDSAITFALGGKLVDIDGGEVAPSLSYKYEKSDGEDCWTEVSAAALKNAGSYRVTATATTDDATYAAIQPFVASLTIAKANYNSVSFADMLNVVYDGEEHTLTITGTLSAGVNATYSVKNQEGTSFTEIGEYEFTVTFNNPDEENYNDMQPLTATLKIVEPSATGISASVGNGTYLDVKNTLDDLKQHITVTINLTGNNSETTEDFELTCDTLREGGLFEVGQQTVTITHGEYTTTVTVTVNKAKAALPVYSGTLRYTGKDIKPKASDFDGFDSAAMTFVESKLQSGKDTGSYKAVFALKDAVRFEWATTAVAPFSKTVYMRAVTFEGESADIQLAANEVAVDWTVDKAVITATKASSGLPVFNSDSYKGAWASAVALKYYTDETCTTEVASNDLVVGTEYYAKVELVDAANFELGDSLAGFVNPFPYTKPAPALSTGAKIQNFLKTYWLWIVLLVAVLLLILLIVVLTKRASRKRQEKEEARRQERMMRYMQTEGMPDYIPMMQSARMAGTTVSPELFAILSGINAKVELLQNSMAGRELPPPTASAGSGSASPELLSILNGMNAKIDKLQSDMAANELASARDDRLRSEIKNAGNGAQSGVSAAEITQMVNAAVKSALAENAEPARTTEPRNLGDRPLVQTEPKIRAQEPVDDGRIVDWGGFYNLADPNKDDGSSK